jgi:hypothetical protein
LLLDRKPLKRAACLGAEGKSPKWLRLSEQVRMAGQPIGYGGVCVDGEAVAKAKGSILIGSVPERLLESAESGEHGPCEAILMPERQRGVSGLHARIRFDKGGAFLEDVAGRAGTWRWDGAQWMRLEGPARLEKQDILAFGAIQSKALSP